MLALPGITAPSQAAFRAAVRRVAGRPGAVVMLGPVVWRAPSLVALLDAPRDLYLCHDFDEEEPWLTPVHHGTPSGRRSPGSLVGALRASGYPMSRIYWSREPVSPTGPVAMTITGRRITLPAAAFPSTDPWIIVESRRRADPGSPRAPLALDAGDA
jgi:hypothetical protein